MKESAVWERLVYSHPLCHHRGAGAGDGVARCWRARITRGLGAGPQPLTERSVRRAPTTPGWVEPVAISRDMVANWWSELNRVAGTGRPARWASGVRAVGARVQALLPERGSWRARGGGHRPAVSGSRQPAPAAGQCVRLPVPVAGRPGALRGEPRTPGGPGTSAGRGGSKASTERAAPSESGARHGRKESLGQQNSCCMIQPENSSSRTSKFSQSSSLYRFVVS